MQVSRRGFLGGLLAVVSAPAIVRVESLMPVKRQLLLPEFLGVDVSYTRNDLLTINMITREAVRLWTNSNEFIKMIDTQYDEQFATEGARIGTQIRIRYPLLRATSPLE